MATRSGLDGQIGFAAESTYGTAITVTRFPELNEEDLSEQLTWLEGEAIRSGKKYKRDGRVSVSRREVKGKTEFNLSNKGFGLLLKACIGSSATATQIASSTAYKQVHVPGDLYGKSMTIQVGRPEPGTGTVRPFGYLGCKVASWELSCSDGGYLKLSITWTGRQEDTITGLATASYIAAQQLFNFSHATLALGGTASTASGEMSVSSGVAVATIIKSISIKGENPLADDRYGLGNAGLKAEPLENDYPTITVDLDAEFAKSELYDVYKAGSSTALQASWSFGDAGSSNPFLLGFIAPKYRLKSAPPKLSGPGLVNMSVSGECYDDETNAPYQIKYVSTDTAI